MVYGYARCSTNEERQDINRQKRELYTLGVTDEKCIYRIRKRNERRPN